MKMTEELLNKITPKVKANAEEARLYADQAGSFHDGGASTIEGNLEIYIKGFNKEIPGDWEEFIKEIQKEQDPEFAD